MGYYTDYELTISGFEKTDSGSYTTTAGVDPLVELQLEQEIKKMGVWEGGDVNSVYWCNAKWYDHDDDMLLLSKRFPEALFELSGSGEDKCDMWTTYYHDGKMQYCHAIITYEEFDQEKLGEGYEVDIAEGVYSYQTER